METLLTTKQVAKKLSVSPNTLRVWRSTKRLDIPYYKVGSCVRYLDDDVNNYIKAHRHAALGEMKNDHTH